IRVFGALPREASVTLPERHLGLVQASEHPRLAAHLDAVGAFVARHLDLDALVAVASGSTTATEPVDVPPPAERIALAQDAAFSFVYPHLLDGWRRAGATILPFSPLDDQGPDPTAGACWLPGGYPELHAGRLAGAETFRRGVRAFASTKPVHGECGGYMAMGEGLIDAEGVRHPMLGLLGLVTSFQKRRMHLGYRLAELSEPIPGQMAGRRLRGHEFHYATILDQPDAPLAQVTDATGAVVSETGSTRLTPQGGRATGTFYHLIAEAT
ncbi:MAG: cobyrinate a,c-diamide synthase, partial [Paracoccaceae bacterium]